MNTQRGGLVGLYPLGGHELLHTLDNINFINPRLANDKHIKCVHTQIKSSSSVNAKTLPD